MQALKREGGRTVYICDKLDKQKFKTSSDCQSPINHSGSFNGAIKLEGWGWFSANTCGTRSTLPPSSKCQHVWLSR